ncbi:hypothetical protein FBY30_2760 [Arthrobacter sp. SLBN-83]|uniref:hypothetical protein n=1 Tax=Arthrobacter sp. SLBN-83 TaxID=2768449 RepID=UPI00116AE2F9|nr:hypothetical protein [Arthrobacter sp. SLBN-83]TQJ60492.1 hypothetical protein FBY30_2760 [Arthrobacter sp. SLBN-83]
MTQAEILTALQGHIPTGDFEGDVRSCMCGWEAPMHIGGDYRNHVAEILAT